MSFTRLCFVFCLPQNIPILKVTFGPDKDTGDSLSQSGVVYLQSRKPEVPSGPLGWRITWLFGRPASDDCCEFKRAGLKRNQNQCYWPSLYKPHSESNQDLFCTEAAILPVLARIVLWRVVWRSAAENPPACFGVLGLTLGQSLSVLGGTGRGRSFPCCAVVGGTFQDANLWRWSGRQRVVLDYDGSANWWAARTGFLGPEKNTNSVNCENIGVP